MTSEKVGMERFICVDLEVAVLTDNDSRKV